MQTENDHLNENLLAYLGAELNDAGIAYQAHPVQLQGGFETQIYRFQLSGVPEQFAHPLVLRLYPARYGSGNAVWESTIQNSLVAASYPAARAHLLCTDLTVLGGAFFVMDYLPGKPLVNAPMEMVPRLLGQSHAALHRIDPDPLVDAIHAGGIDRDVLFPDYRFNSFKDQASKFLWLREATDWLVDNRPPDPEKLAVCHGDFHPLNILIQDGRVSGVLDWPGFMIADPVLDIAFTLVLSTIPFKHLAPSLGMDVSALDFELFAQQYLKDYRAERPFDGTHLDYYRVMRCVRALMEGAQGQAVWQYPPIVKDLLEYIHSITGISIDMPVQK